MHLHAAVPLLIYSNRRESEERRRRKRKNLPSLNGGRIQYNTSNSYIVIPAFPLSLRCHRCYNFCIKSLHHPQFSKERPDRPFPHQNCLGLQCHLPPSPTGWTNFRFVCSEKRERESVREYSPSVLLPALV